MKPIILAFCLIAFIINTVSAQKYIDKEHFFIDTAVINATLTLNIKKVLANKDKEGAIFPATFSFKAGDSLNVNDPVSLQVRGISDVHFVTCPH